MGVLSLRFCCPVEARTFRGTEFVSKESCQVFRYTQSDIWAHSSYWGLGSSEMLIVVGWGFPEFRTNLVPSFWKAKQSEKKFFWRAWHSGITESSRFENTEAGSPRLSCSGLQISQGLRWLAILNLSGYSIWAGIVQSVERLATGWMVWGPNPGGGEIFRTRPDRPWNPPNLLYNGHRGFPGGSAPFAWRWPPTPSSVEVEGRVELYIFSPYGPSWPVLGWALPFPLPLWLLHMPLTVTLQPSPSCEYGCHVTLTINSGHFS
jgi:hypothetical protein